MSGQHRSVQIHRWPAGDIMMLIVAVVAFGFALCLLTPSVPVSGPATVVIYDMLPRPVWGVVWAFIALMPVGAVAYPTWETRRWAVLVVTIASVLWFGALLAPLFSDAHVGNALVIIWVLPIALGVVTTVKVGFYNETIWRPMVKPRR